MAQTVDWRPVIKDLWGAFKLQDSVLRAETRDLKALVDPEQFRS